MRFFFTGFMGSGKSFWAKKMSLNMSIPYIDLDEYIEAKEKMTISDIFNLKGEAYFRQYENLCLKEIVSLHDHFILSCGGGTPCFHDNKKIMTLCCSNNKIENINGLKKFKFLETLLLANN